jgi:cobalt-zinc-cadmium resistance protein CzcA
MINHIIAFSVKNKLIIGLLTIALIIGGIWSMALVPIDAQPDITNNQVQVITQAPSLGTEDIEQIVTYQVEVAMANIPGVTEIRSVSRFGLSVVTIVFEDDMGTYLPRQLVAEKLTEVKEKIPSGFGEPEIGPISTGLGEIYQYTLEVDPAFKEKYSSTDLRTMQDWIIRRQMAMVPGVVEVNAFGGNVKQYEIAVNPHELRAMGLTISNIFSALESNNQNTGGAYIEKDHQANFIRAEGLIRNLQDIEKIVVKTVDGVPVTIKDVASVGFGKSVQYGGFTKDGQGDAVGGMILMLKGANSNEVIRAVKKRMEEIQKSLPEGVTIESFFDRSALISKTTGTVSTNLTEGALIVIFVLVFLLGNWRGGLIVASTIPLSLLFAFILMRMFNVWGNLMSLGAIDFGIIVDGAVIIVESTVFILHGRIQKSQRLSRELRDKAAMEASAKMMSSAFFGQLIILIVFLPILALHGIEGKMFKPMALTFMFAMTGVIILCLTYVPMMSAWLIRAEAKEKLSWGDKLVHWIEDRYEYTLIMVLRNGKLVVTSSLILLGLTVFTYTRMGGEFVPQLDEGDLAFHALLKPGSSLSEAVKTTTKIEQIVKAEFPEVKHILSRIGVADVPTDPMPMDIADCFVILKPKDEWTSVQTKEELIGKMKEKLEMIPGVNYEFTQPIEMRFNELLTGVREDIAIKLFGEDPEILEAKAGEIGKIVSGIAGVADMKVEATSGLPQMTVNYDRDKLAQYGLNIEELNTTVQSAFGGGITGVIFEGEKRFDLVVRLKEEYRQSIDDLKNLPVNLSDENMIPLGEVAEISYQPGPMQISRENTNRRTYVGINVRGRDVKSLVHEIRQELEKRLDLPPGYYIRYGGAFENLERASQSLRILVPVALGLIFVMIFFALKSVKQTIMIYIAIPLAAIGGVFSLWIRGMPFSISAGVGFIVLFGVAVLNGLVLISGWNELKAESVTGLDERIHRGARRRIRPILLTALTDVLGFLPMAVSTSAGAEVQQPLATVVIGGMITATLLTLFVLPVLYKWIESRKSAPALVRNASALVLIAVFLILPAKNLRAQENHTITTLDQAIRTGIRNNGDVQVTRNGIELERQGKKAAFNPSKTDIGFQYGQYNSYEKDFSFELNQSFEFPSVYSRRGKLADEKIRASEIRLMVSVNELKYQISQPWYHLSYLLDKKRLLLKQDSIYTRFLHAANIRYETGESTYLEKVAAETQVMEMNNSIRAVAADIKIIQEQLRVLLNDTIPWIFAPASFGATAIPDGLQQDSVKSNPELAYARQQIKTAQAEKKVESAKLLPELTLGYFNQSLIGSETVGGAVAGSSDRFTGIRFGVSVPLFFGSGKAQVNAARIQTEIAETQASYFQNVLQSQFGQQLQEVLKYRESLNYYTEKALPQADLIMVQAQKSFENGAIDYVAYIQSMNQALQLKFGYLDAIDGFNQAVSRLEYISGK